MSKLSHTCQAIAIAASLAITTGAALAKEPTPVNNDPYAWLEDVTGDKPLEWVKAQNV